MTSSCQSGVAVRGVEPRLPTCIGPTAFIQTCQVLLSGCFRCVTLSPCARIGWFRRRCSVESASRVGGRAGSPVLPARSVVFKVQDQGRAGLDIAQEQNLRLTRLCQRNPLPLVGQTEESTEVEAGGRQKPRSHGEVERGCRPGMGVRPWRRAVRSPSCYQACDPGDASEVPSWHDRSA